MRFPTIVILATVTSLGVPFVSSVVWAAVETDVPYRTQVGVREALVRGGPDDRYQPTGRLVSGDVVTVLQEAPGGWRAIEPPAGSYSWVFARHVDLANSNVGRINKDGVASRVGSQFGDRRRDVLVRLERGDEVQIIGGDEEGGQLWYKITPPAGEFRWVHADDLHRRDNSTGDESASFSDRFGNAPVPSQWVATVAHDEPATTGTPAQAVAAAPPPPPATLGDELPQGRYSPVTAGGARDQEATRSAQPATSLPSGSPLAPGSSQNMAVTSARPPAPSATPQPMSAEFTHRLVLLDLQLSQTVASAPQTWRLDELRRQANALVADGEAVVEREAARHVAAKIERFISIQQRFQQAEIAGTTSTEVAARIAERDRQSPPGAGSDGAPITPLISSGAQELLAGSPAAPSTRSDELVSFDAVGTVQPVRSRRPGAPKYALVDDVGRIVALVTPQPAVDLQQHIGRRVGVVGQRGYLPEYRRSHVAAGRVELLGTPQRR